MTFEEIGLSPELLKGVKDLGFESAMPVQEEVIPTLLESDCNLIALAQTGTGKTAAFGLPIIQKIDLYNKNTEALIICPTRELCIQIANDCKKFAKYIPECSVVPVYGGASIEVQIKELKKGAKIIVATPGRINDLLDRGKVDLSSIKYLVLDEADEMLNMGFKEDLDSILEQTPTDKYTLLFSATMPDEVEEIAGNYIENPIRIQIGSKNQGSNNVRHFYYLVHAKDRYLALKRIADYYPDIYAIIFCRTKVETQEVADMLIRDGYNADSLHGDLSQAQRDHVMSRFRLRNIQMLVATDVAARGLDVSNLTHVINYNLPDELEQYVHRSGRTGRADKQGISIAILNLREKHKIKNIEKLIQKTFEKAEIPTGKQVCRKQLFNMINKLENVIVNEEEIEDFIPEVIAKLSWLDREELIKKFVSVEFNRFLEYYKDAPDLNVDEKKEEKENKKQSKNKTESKKGEFTRLFLSLGRKDRIVPQRIIGLINDYCPNTRVEIGKIDILDNFSYVEIGSNDVDDVLFAFEDKFYKGRALTFELAQAKKPTKTKRRDSKTKNQEFKTKNQEFKTKNQNNKTKNKNRKS
ncbi:MAG: DEAD/DEAH box helicase [Bacteroidales bacterium]|nr:DEAD/DEAH box helicase [Bacteroidales bacterium]